MKAGWKAAAVLALCLLLGGCTLFSPVSDLLAAPSFSARNDAIRRAFESAFGTQVQYKSPISGQYLSAFVTADLDGDAVDEAMVFYLPDSYTKTVHIGVLDLVGGVWQRTDVFEGGGSDVYSVETADLDADGETEVIICWSTLENTRVMSVYTCAGAPFSMRRLFEAPYTEKLTADLDGDDCPELFTLTLHSEAGSQTAQAAVLRKNGSFISVLSKCDLDSRVSGYKRILYRQTDSGSVLYADAYKGEAQMITEVICFDSALETLTAPLLDPETRTNEQTWRSVPISCRDLLGNGEIYIPCQQEVLPHSEILRGSVRTDTPLYVTRWCAFRDDGLEVGQQTLIHRDLHWMFRIPDDWYGRFTVQIDRDANTWSFYQLDPHTGEKTDCLCSVLFTTRTAFAENTGGLYNNCLFLCGQGEDVLLSYGIRSEGSPKIDADQLREAFVYLGQ